MRIGFVTTYPPIDCGIATYSSYLIEELEKLGNLVYIVSETEAKGKRVYPVYRKQDPDIAWKIFQAILKIKPDIVHIQHEFGLYGPSKGVSIISLIYKLRLSKIPVVTTLHTVYEDFSYENKIITEAIIRASDAIIIHEDYQKKSIFRNIYSFDRIFVIAHGVRKVNFISDTKSKLQIKDKKVILLIGYLRPSKNFDLIVNIFPKIKEKVPNSLLFIAGGVRMGEYPDYMNSFKKLVNDSPARDNIKFLKGKSPQKIFDNIICCADVAVMPYTVGAQSGIMSHLLAFGVPLVTSDLRIFTETFNKAKCGLISKTDKDYIENIVNILTNNKLRQKMSSEALRLVNKELSWGIAARKTRKVYQSIIDNYSFISKANNQVPKLSKKNI